MERKYCVYVHINKITGGMYFGITCQLAQSRWRGGNGYSEQYFGKIIKQFGWENFDHIILKDNLSEQEAEEEEQFLIAKYNTTDENFGYNKSKGRQSSSPQLSKKVYRYSLNGDFIGEFESQGEAEKVTGCRRDTIGRICKGEFFASKEFTFSYFPLTKEQIQQRLEERNESILKNKQQIGERSKKVNSQPIYQLNKDTGEIIKEFPSQQEAARALGIDQKNISVAIQKHHCSHGFKWVKKDDYINMEENKAEP